uniref:COX assembly mitochondrial protein n=1 Tax=Lygus hesperus TaxID=30085 RepID=A0A0A9X4S7_LYGHE
MVSKGELSTETPLFNPHGLGDPNDRSLRKVEVEVLIPKKMREKAKAEKCTTEVADFHACCKENGLTLVFSCQKENQKMKDCLAHWYNDEGFKKLCREEYLNERSNYRLTGKKTSERIKRM